MKPSERFFASLMLCGVSDLSESNEVTGRTKVLYEICSRLSIPQPAKLPASHGNASEFYAMRASLVMEESRCILSEGLKSHCSEGRRCGRQQHGGGIRVTLAESKEMKKTGYLVLTFEKFVEVSRSGRGLARDMCFSPREVYDMRPGSCFLIVPPASQDNKESWVMGSVVPQPNYKQDGGGCGSLSLMVYETVTLNTKITGDWRIIYVTTLVSQVRQFEACARAPNVAFMAKLLGWKEATHIKFEDTEDEDDEEEKGEEKKVEEDEDEDDGFIGFNDCRTRAVRVKMENDAKPGAKVEERKDGIKNASNLFVLPQLNPTQGKAATSFLSSPKSTLMLVQGPPGTGKSTFLVSVIAKCLMSQSRRILVAAPTNKAIAVLASRFIDALQDNTACFNIVMIGVEEKLVPEEETAAPDPLSVSSLSSSLKRIFAYTWLSSMVEDFKSLRRYLYSPSTHTHESLFEKATHLTRKLMNSIPSLAKSTGASGICKDFIASLTEKNTIQSEQFLELLISALIVIPSPAITKEILATADVIFCTLSTSGVSAMKATKRIDDLFIDEAAAATEPELLIPFHLSPDRMLAVGDPKQLPATVFSKFAMELKLDRSMHERLMFDCHKEYVMLNEQYRMTPNISAFPSKHFYQGKLLNGGNVVRSDYQSDITLLNRAPYSFVQVEGIESRSFGGSYSNLEEAKAILHIVKSIRQAATTTKQEENTKPWYSPDKLRIITFYQGQVTLLRQLFQQHGLSAVLVATVDSSQGCEADIVLVSFVRSNTKHTHTNSNARHTAGFLTDDRRVNVALTRAKYQLICVGNARGTLSQSGAATLQAMVQDAEERQCVLSMNDVTVATSQPVSSSNSSPIDVSSFHSYQKIDSYRIQRQSSS